MTTKKRKRAIVLPRRKQFLTREKVVAAFQRDPSGRELALLLTEHGIGVPVETDPPPRSDPFRPLPPLG